MITGELRTRIDRLWDAFWTSGISNPLEVVEQITYLIFLRRLDDSGGWGSVHTPGTEHLRWSRFSRLEAGSMFRTVRDEVFPWLRAVGGVDSTYAEHMRDARFTIPTPALLARAVDMLDRMPLGDGDTKGDLYEYMLAKIATAGRNGQFRTPRHIIDLMVRMLDPVPGEQICDPACGTAGFLVGAADHLRRAHPARFERTMFHGFDFDSTMLRIASMNLLMHGVERPDIRYRDSLAQSVADEAGRYSMVLANPPFAGSLDLDGTADDLLREVRTRKTELLFLALILRLLAPGGRAAVIVPEGVLFGSTKAHKDIRRRLVEEHGLDAVVRLPGGVFKPYAGVCTAILVFTKDARTDRVWFYDVATDGFGLDDKRAPLLSADRLGAAPATADPADHDRNNLPDVLARWTRRDGPERDRDRTERSFTVPRSEIVAHDCDLSLHRYKRVVREPVEYRPPLEIIENLERVESEIQQRLSDLKRRLG